ncbi:MAG: protein-L-isoaspartate O-methyltransferase, partial [Oligoflexia bacterium]|nr:protein-L-isoaspartate O-methyltransferase [Oligoflexia bacterium]
PHHKVLEIGTGCGYQTAVLSRLAHKIYSVEIIEKLHRQAQKNLNDLNIKNVELRLGSGTEGWSEKGPFDRIMVTCARKDIPQSLLRQLAIGGKLIAPVGEPVQRLTVWTKKNEDSFDQEVLIPVKFVRFVD